MNEKDEPGPGHGRPVTPGTAGPAERPLTPVRPWLRPSAAEQDVPAAASGPESQTPSDAAAGTDAGDDRTDRPQARPAARPEHRPGVLSPARPWQQRRTGDTPPTERAGGAEQAEPASDPSAADETEPVGPARPSNEHAVLRRLSADLAGTDTTARRPGLLHRHTAPSDPAPAQRPASESRAQRHTSRGGGRLRRAAEWLFEQAPEPDAEAEAAPGPVSRDARRAAEQEADEPTWTRTELLDLAGPQPAPIEPAAEPAAEPVPVAEPDSVLAPEPEPQPVPEPVPEPEPEPQPVPEPQPAPEAPRRRPRPGPGPAASGQAAPAAASPVKAAAPRADVRPGIRAAAPAQPPARGSSDSTSLRTDGPRRPGLRRAVQMLVVVCAVVVAAVLVRTFVAAPYFIPSASMEPTLHGCSGCNNDHVLVNKLSYKLHGVHRGDVIVFDRPATWQVSEKHLIKRVIGLPGDVLTVRKGKLYVNGLQLQEPYLDSKCGPTTSLGESPAKATTRYGPVPKDDVFVMGDNRCDSSDSRAFGPVPESDIVGRAFVIIWPLGRLHYL